MKNTIKRLDKLASELCRLKAGGVCKHCGRQGHDPHHIISRNHKRLRWDQKNLIFLCRNCHISIHHLGTWAMFDEELDRSVKIWHLSELKELEQEIKLKIKAVKNASI